MKTVIVLLCLVFMAASAYSQSSYKETVSWAISAEPPITYVDKGEFKGYGVEYIKMIQAELPQYNHIIYSAGNYKRLAQDVVHGPLTAAIGLFKTDERLQVMYFAKVPVFFFFNIQLAMRQETYEEFNKPEQLSLEALLKNTKYVLGISSGRNYSEEVQQILTKDAYRQNIQYITQGNVTQSLLQMLDAKRIDFTLLYPEEASYLSKNDHLKNKIMTVSLKEIDQFSFSWPVVTRNLKGELLASEITKVLLKIRQKKKFRELYMSYISNNNHKTYDDHFENDFLKVYEN